MTTDIESIRDKFYKDLTNQVKFIKQKLRVSRREHFILGGIEAIIINCNRRKALVHSSIVNNQDITHLEIFVDNELFQRHSKDTKDSFVTIDLGNGTKVDLINHIPAFFNGSDFRFATAEFLFSDAELSMRKQDSIPYGITDEVIEDLKFSLGIIPRLVNSANSHYDSIIPKDSLDGDYPTMVLKTILAIIEEDVKQIYFKFLKIVLDTTVNLTVLDAFISKNGLKESLVERILIIRSQNLTGRMEELLYEHQIDLATV